MKIKEKLELIKENKAEYLRTKRKVERMPTESIKQRIIKMVSGAESLSDEDAKLYQILLDVYKSRVDDVKFYSLINKI